MEKKNQIKKKEEEMIQNWSEKRIQHLQVLPCTFQIKDIFKNKHIRALKSSFLFFLLFSV